MRFTKMLPAFAAAAALTAAGSASAETWRIQSHLPSGHPVYKIEERWVADVNTMLGGRLELELLPGGAVVAYNETIDAIPQGIVDGDITSPVFFAGRDPAFALLGDLVGGYDTWAQALAFCEYGGGKELLQELYAGYGIHLAGCGNSGIESVVSTKKAEGIADMEGIKIRAPEGLASDLFRKMGAAPVNLPGSEVYTSIEKGVIDASDFGSYVMNKQSGMHDIAKYPILRLHSMPVLSVSFNKDKFDAQPEDVQAILEMAARDLTVRVNLEDVVAEGGAIAEDEAAGVEPVEWSDADRRQMRDMAAELWAEYAERSDMAGKAYQAHTDFMRQMGLLD